MIDGGSDYLPQIRPCILKSIINATCPGHQEQVNLMLSKFPAIFTQWGITGCTISNSKI